MLKKMARVVVVTVIIAVAFVFAEPVRYEAEAAQRTGDATLSSNGQFVQMREGNLTFTVNGMSGVEFYNIVIRYANNYSSAKDQNIHINGTLVTTVNFPLSPEFQTLTGATKVRLNPGSNTIAIIKNWGWIDVDYIEVMPYEGGTTWNISNTLVTAGASQNALEMYRFILDSFGKATISGVMSDPGSLAGNQTIESIPEVAHIRNASNNKTPALIGFDFMQGIGKQVETDNWGRTYTDAAIRLAEELYSKGGIPAFMWHWRDPSRLTNEFYNSPGEKRPEFAAFDVSKAFPNGTADPGSDEYKAIVRDIDTLASWYLKKLADKDIPILWRPLHEAAGAWFWWGDNGAAATKGLWRFMFDRLTKHHGFKNLIWVWTCEEGGHALDWYPGDEYVDIIGRDIYVDANNYGSLVSNFESLKTLYQGKKIIALSENGSVPDPEIMEADGANWAFFMPWYGSHTTEHNTASHWNKVMNHSFVLTLDEMPGWGQTSVRGQQSARTVTGRTLAVSVRGKTLNVVGFGNSPITVKLVNIHGKTVRTFKSKGSANLPLKNISAGRYVVEIKKAGKRVNMSAVTVR